MRNHSIAGRVDLCRMTRQLFQEDQVAKASGDRSEADVKRILRRIAQSSQVAAFAAISEARKASNPGLYLKVMRALKLTSFKHRNLPLVRPINYRDLIFSPAMEPLSLRNELLWAAAWLSESANIINEFLLELDEVQELFSEGNLSQIESRMEGFVSRNGWSFWATELLFASKQELHGSEAVKAFSQSLQVASRNRASALLAVVLTDRNDTNFSFDSFQNKVVTSANRFSLPWLRAYLQFRALGSVVDLARDLPWVLATDITSSIYDYYESVIEIAHLVKGTPELALELPAVRKLVEDLQTIGIRDHRLGKIGVAIGSNEVIRFRARNSTSKLDILTERLISVASEPLSDAHGLIRQLDAHVTQCESQGLAAQDATTELLKIGVNFKSIPIGQAVALKALQCSSPIDHGSLIRQGMDLILSNYRLEDVFSNIDAHAMSIIRLAALSKPSELQAACIDIVAVLDNDDYEIRSAHFGSLETLWLSRYLAIHGNFGRALQLATRLESQGATWARHASKLKVMIYARSGDLESALLQASNILLETPESAYELALSSIFRNRSWSSFKKTDNALVALVAHYANTAEPDPDTRFICRMACRAFYLTGEGTDLEVAYNRRNAQDAKRLIAFLENAWTEENFALVEAFSSTQEMRRERIRVLQFLLNCAPHNAAIYSSIIKDLTFDETLWRGIQQINETRIFVNEPAISRWADKNLLPDFERWRLLSNSTSTGLIQNDIVSNYLVEPTTAILVRELPASDMTEANILLVAMLDRLLKQFLLDPIDGLDCYLSLRIRHGTLRGTLLGPLEERNLLLAGPSTEAAFCEFWFGSLYVTPEIQRNTILLLTDFAIQLQNIVRVLLDETIRIRTREWPQGAFPIDFEPKAMPLVIRLFAPDMSFNYFLASCYTVFWAFLRPSREAISGRFRVEVKNAVQAEFDAVLEKLRKEGPAVQMLVTALQGVATATQLQCDIVADWFVSAQGVEQQVYKLSAAVEIARQATKNVYRHFSSEVRLSADASSEIDLSAYGLATLTDCLCIALENAWKHSGLGEGLGAIALSANFEPETKVLTLLMANSISDSRREELSEGELARLQNKYLQDLPIDLVAKEGGSGLAKLARLAASVDRAAIPPPLYFGIDGEGQWYVKVSIQMREREGIFDAYV
jgi:hypothetical protein